LQKKSSFMLEQLISLIQEHGQETVVQNPVVPNEYNQQVMNEAGSSIVGGLQQALAGGGLAQVMQLISGASSSQQGGIASLMTNPLVQNMIQTFSGKLTNQFQLNPNNAQQVGADLIPQVLSRLSGQVNDPANPGIDINSVIRSLTGGGTGNTDFSGILQKLQSGGSVSNDLQDIIGNVSRAASQQGEGGIMDLLKGFMK
jgi:hypothetical protein